MEVVAVMLVVGIFLMGIWMFTVCQNISFCRQQLSRIADALEKKEGT